MYRKYTSPNTYIRKWLNDGFNDCKNSSNWRIFLTNTEIIGHDGNSNWNQIIISFMILNFEFKIPKRCFGAYRSMSAKLYDYNFAIFLLYFFLLRNANWNRNFCSNICIWNWMPCAPYNLVHWTVSFIHNSIHFKWKWECKLQIFKFNVNLYCS